MAKVEAARQLAKIADLTPDARNANKGTERGGAMVESSLRKYGAGRSILLDKHGRTIAGNKTAEHAGAIGIEDLIVIKATVGIWSRCSAPTWTLKRTLWRRSWPSPKPRRQGGDGLGRRRARRARTGARLGLGSSTTLSTRGTPLFTRK